VEFLLLAGSTDQAFDIAQSHQEMDTFARIIAAEATPDQYAKIAAHYENHGEYEKAADVCVLAQQHLKAVQLFLKVGPESVLRQAFATGVASTNTLALVGLRHCGASCGSSNPCCWIQSWCNSTLCCTAVGMCPARRMHINQPYRHSKHAMLLPCAFKIHTNVAPQADPYL
jgi:hypothetical protein